MKHKWRVAVAALTLLLLTGAGIALLATPWMLRQAPTGMLLFLSRPFEDLRSIHNELMYRSSLGELAARDRAVAIFVRKIYEQPETVDANALAWLGILSRDIIERSGRLPPFLQAELPDLQRSLLCMTLLLEDEPTAVAALFLLNDIGPLPAQGIPLLAELMISDAPDTLRRIVFAVLLRSAGRAGTSSDSFEDALLAAHDPRCRATRSVQARSDCYAAFETNDISIRFVQEGQRSECEVIRRFWSDIERLQASVPTGGSR